MQNHRQNEKFDEKSCGMVLFRKQGAGRLYLLLHYPGGHWDFPKGHMAMGESELDTASRELIEETGIEDFQILENFRELVSYCYFRGNQKLSKQVAFFIGRTDQSEVRISSEHKEFLWLPFLQALNQITYENSQDLLKKTEKFLND